MSTDIATLGIKIVSDADAATTGLTNLAAAAGKTQAAVTGLEKTAKPAAEAQRNRIGLRASAVSRTTCDLHSRRARPLGQRQTDMHLTSPTNYNLRAPGRAW
jgi:hypothetical protein